MGIFSCLCNSIVRLPLAVCRSLVAVESVGRRSSSAFILFDSIRMCNRLCNSGNIFLQVRLPLNHNHFSSIKIYFSGDFVLFSLVSKISGICKQFGSEVSRLTLTFQLFSPALFIASSAVLPSTLSMYATFVAYGAYLHRHHRLAILACGFSVLMGWPFTALLK